MSNVLMNSAAEVTNSRTEFVQSFLAPFIAALKKLDFVGSDIANPTKHHKHCGEFGVYLLYREEPASIAWCYPPAEEGGLCKIIVRNRVLTGTKEQTFYFEDLHTFGLAVQHAIDYIEKGVNVAQAAIDARIAEKESEYS